MATLISPGTSVTIIDDSNYTTSAAGTVPFILVATEQDKLNAAGALAQYTTAANAGKVFLVTSQREIINNYGKAKFLTSQGSPVHGYELNEYGLYAAYSALGVSNAAYIMRADVDLKELAGTGTRPAGKVNNGTLWLDTVDTAWGVFEWNSGTGFRLVNTANAVGSGQLNIITNANLINANKPVSTLGKPGDYAIDTTSVDNPVFYKAQTPAPGITGQWVEVGSEDWFNAWPAVVGTNSNPSLVAADAFLLNGTLITLTSGLLGDLVGVINAATITGVTAAITPDNRLALYNTSDTPITLSNSVNAPLTNLGIDYQFSYARPAFVASKHTQSPAGGVWTSHGADPRPTGSVWFKTTSPNNGANFIVKRYDAALDSWTLVPAPVYGTEAEAIFALDPVAGGANIPANSVYIQDDVFADKTFTFKLFVRKAGVSKIFGATNPGTLASGSKAFTIKRTIPGSGTISSAVTLSFTGTTVADFVAVINNAGVTNIHADLETSGAVSITHTAGGSFELVDSSGTPLATLGFTTSSVGARASDATVGGIWVSNWLVSAYTVSGSTPETDPSDGALWYYNDPTQFDILVNTGSAWSGYIAAGVDSRGFDLSLTNPTGPMVSASEPLLQSDGTALADGDLWIDTANLEEFPRIYRFENAAWVLVDVTDHTSENGVLFADARWGTSGAVNVVTDELLSIQALLNSSYVDSDCPSYALYPRGTLLFNTRRSGLNVKKFVVNYFMNAPVVPSYLNAWVTQSGNDAAGVALLGRKAQRAVVVAAMAAAVENSADLLEETRNFNLIAAPNYPELNEVLVQLNVNRKETAFIIADSPMRLSTNSNDIATWAQNLNNAPGDGEDGFVTYYEYMGGWYPSGYTLDLDGNPAVVPSSHMVLRSIIRSDQKSYPWFAFAGTRRGVVDNANAIGYIDPQTGIFQSVGVSESIRNVLYTGKVNPISVLDGSGIVIYGQKTRSSISSALDRCNVARLVVYLRKQLDLIARPYLFEPNDEITRKEIKNQIEKELNSIQSQRGISDYAVVCDLSNNTKDRIDRNELWVDVAIEPVKAVEFIYIPVRIKNTGDIKAGL